MSLASAIAEAITRTLTGRLQGVLKQERFIAGQAAILAQIASMPGDRTPFRVIARRRTVIELKRLAKRGPAALAGLHALATQALAAVHVMRGDLEASPELAKPASEAALAWLAEQTDADLPEPDLKPTDLQAEAFATVVAYTYERLTGRPAHHGDMEAGFVDLLDALGVGAGVSLGNTTLLAKKIASLRKEAEGVSSDENVARWRGNLP